MPELKDKIRQHFDEASPFYHQLWGIHIHHGYWLTGKESNQLAQEQLIDELVQRAGIQHGATVLDVGCGIGGTAIYLAQRLNAKVTGITLAPKQVAMADQLAQEHGVRAKFLAMDGEHITLRQKFDIVWTVETISHYYNKENFFSSAARLLKPGGRVAMAVWLKAEHLTPERERRYIKPIERGMLLPYLCTMHDYLNYLHQYGFRLLSAEDVAPHTAKTWELTLGIIKKPALWKEAAKRGKEFVDFLHAFQAMKRGYQTRTFVYGLIAAEKVS